MRSRLLTGLALVAAFCLGWSVRGEQDVVSAQAARKPIMMTRIYTGADGLTHSERVEMKLTQNGTSTMKATGVEFSSRPAAPAGDWHTGPRRQFVITLSGRAELEVANGQKVPIEAGNINLIEDTTGKGHITHNIADRIVVTIPLEDQTVSHTATTK
jgi:quercetin dioxygenase-like cupin family protein